MKIEINKIKAKGYADSYGEFNPEVFAIAVPLLNQGGQAFAGINIVIPILRISKEKIYQEYVPSLINKGKEISKILGNF